MVEKSESDDIRRFSRWSSTYEQAWLQRFLFDRVHKVVTDLVTRHGIEPQSILDVGCGTGRLLRRVGAHWPSAHLIGVDPAEGMVEVARRLTPAATFHVAMAESLPLADASVDVVLSTISFHHWQDPALAVCEVARVLRPGGRFILADHCLPAALAKDGRLRRISSGERQDLFNKAGLQVQMQRSVLKLFFVLVTVGAKN